jgi:hypothetical protein
MKHLEEFKLNEDVNRDNFFDRAWQVITSFQESGINAWDEKGKNDPIFLKKLRDLKYYLNQIEEL